MVVTHAIESVFYSSFLHRIRTPYFMLRTVTSIIVHQRSSNDGASYDPKVSGVRVQNCT